MCSNELLKYLETSKGRDRFLRLSCYASKLIARLASPNVSSQLNKFSKELSSCRAAFRLLDSIPAVANATHYGLGKEDEDFSIRVLNVISNIIDVIFCPADHISWAISQGILKSKSTTWDTSNTVLWVASLYVNIMINLIKINIALNRKGEIMKSMVKDSKEMKLLSNRVFNLTLSTVRLSMDIAIAVHYLPSGIMWSGSLANWHVGALGTMSSLIALYQSFK